MPTKPRLWLFQVNLVCNFVHQNLPTFEVWKNYHQFLPQMDLTAAANATCSCWCRRPAKHRNFIDLGRVPLAGSIRLILLIRAMERDVPADRIGSSGTSQNGDPNRSNMADALATYWRRVSIRITATVSNCVAKMTHFVMNLTSFYIIQLLSYDFLLSFKSTDIPDWQQSAFIFYISWQKQIGSLYYLVGSDRIVPL